MRAPGWLPICGVLAARGVRRGAAAARARRPTPRGRRPTTPRRAAIAEHRQHARRHAQAGDLAAAAREWQIVLLLAPGDDAARTELDADARGDPRRAFARTCRRETGAAQRRRRARDAGDAEGARARSRQRGGREGAARHRPAEAHAHPERSGAARRARARRRRRGAAAPRRHRGGAEASESYDIEQRIEMFRAGDVNGGLREFRAFVDANPNNEAARQRIATTRLRARRVESEQKGSREQALMLVRPGGEPARQAGSRMDRARADAAQGALRRVLREGDAGLPDATSRGAIRLWETSLTYDPQNRKAQREAAGSPRRARQAEAHRAGQGSRSRDPRLAGRLGQSARLAELLAHLLLELERALALELRLLIGRIELEDAIPLRDREVEVLPLERLRGLAIVAADERSLRRVALQDRVAVAGDSAHGLAERAVRALEVAARLLPATLLQQRGEVIGGRRRVAAGSATGVLACRRVLGLAGGADARAAAGGAAAAPCRES